MTYKEMIQICKDNNGKCKNCKLNCVYDWYETNQTWCLKDLRAKYNNKYKMHIERGEQMKADETAKEYASIEIKYLGTNKK